MLLGTATEDDLERFLTDDRWGSQEKKNGKHLFVRASGQRVTGINKKGLECPIPIELQEALKNHHALFEGELVNNVLHAFDFPAAGPDPGEDYRSLAYHDREERLRQAVEALDAPEFVKAVPLAIGEQEKCALLAALR